MRCFTIQICPPQVEGYHHPGTVFKGGANIKEGLVLEIEPWPHVKLGTIQRKDVDRPRIPTGKRLLKKAAANKGLILRANWIRSEKSGALILVEEWGLTKDALVLVQPGRLGVQLSDPRIYGPRVLARGIVNAWPNSPSRGTSYTGLLWVKTGELIRVVGYQGRNKFEVPLLWNGQGFIQK